jgi:DNA processing protein
VKVEHWKYVMALREVGKVGPKRFQQIVTLFGSPENLFKSSKEEIAEKLGVNLEKAQEIFNSQDKIPEIEKHLLYLEEENIGVITILDENYPENLKGIDSPPPLLYFKGEFPLKKEMFVAVIGTHNATAKGIEEGVKIGKKLAQEDIVVVSGLARGIDSSGHLGAIAGNGKTYAIMGSGLNNIYPKENIGLANQIVENGALISEYPLSASVNIGQLMARNRIIVGLAQAVIMVETEHLNSGTLDTAQKAMEQGRLLFAVRKGNEEFIAELEELGAVIIEGAEELDLVTKYLLL